MKFRDYLKYLLIFIVVGIIAVSIVFAINKNKTKEDEVTKEEQIEEEDLDIGREDAVEVKEEAVEDKEEVEISEEDYYVSRSDNFKNYSFICPDNWVLFEENDGSRILIKNDLGSRGMECFFILVEPLSSIKNLKNDDIIQKYTDITCELDGAELMEEEILFIDGLSAKLNGYGYNSLMDEYFKEIDLLSFIKKDGYIYLIKYMSSNIDIEDAKKTYKDFISTFSFTRDVERVKEDSRSTSINILILGDDSAYDRAGGRVSGRADIIILLNVNLEIYDGTIITIPRDTWVNIPDHGEGKINGARAVGGNELMVRVVEELSGLEIDNYIITDFDGFKPLIDFLGGVTIEIEEDLADGFSGCYLSKGIHHLNGEQALALCRNRHREGGAYAREEESAKVILALYEQKTTFEKIISLPAFVNFLLNYTWTDFTFNDILKLLPAFGKVKASDIRITTIPSWPQMIGDVSAVVYDEEATMKLFEQIKNQ
ncbi:MAG: LCP family protein [Actinobacteria bacterium]|nr:LCP family protein [Actinomycetota bacterium]